jgi:hypothetical protein
MQTQLVEDQARLTEMNQELNAAQAKAIPEIERRRDALHVKSLELSHGSRDCGAGDIECYPRRGLDTSPEKPTR